MFQERVKTLEGFSLVLDGIAITAAFGLALLFRILHPSLPFLNLLPTTEWVVDRTYRAEYVLVWLAAIVASLVYAKARGFYGRLHVQRWRFIVNAYSKITLVILFSTGALVFALKMSISRVFFGYFFVLVFLLLATKQAILEWLLTRIRENEMHLRHALVVGQEIPALWFAEMVRTARVAGYRLVGVLTTDGAERGGATLGNLDDLDWVLLNHPVEEVFFIGSAQEIAALGPVAHGLVERGRIVSIVTDLGGKQGLSGRVTQFNGIPMISWGPMPRDEVSSALRRTIDIGVAGVALLALGPLLGAIALAIRVFDPGPVLFRQRRLGRGGRPFNLYKFRSMRANAEEVLRSNPELLRAYRDNDFKLPAWADPRITPLGRLLRKTSLDELPQLWNVLRGEMTIVGPRPIVPEEIAKYAPYADLLLSVRPGLTGQWQVSGRSGLSYPARAFVDLNYVGNNTVSDDLAIMLRTLPVVLRRKGAL